MNRKETSIRNTELYRYSGSYSAPPSIGVVSVPEFWGEMYTGSHDLSKLGKSNTGGPWFMYNMTTKRETYEVPPWYRARWCGGKFIADRGNELASPSSSSVRALFLEYEDEMYSKAATAIARTNPSRPEMDLTTSVGEVIADGFPSMIGLSLWKEKARVLKGAGSEYLNYEFGWVPFISDIRNFARIVSQSNKLVSQYERGSGVRQRRRYSFPGSITTTRGADTSSNLFPTDTSTWYPGTTDIFSVAEDELWFSGAFKYYVPESGLGRFSALANKLFGVGITPSDVWELAPWSWALDWQSNIGDVLSNISYLGPDASVMEWGYMMRSRIVTRTITTRVTGANNSGNPVRNRAVVLNSEQKFSAKTRIPGSPYGFSANPAPLTGRQIAILAALGLSKFP